MACSMFRLVVAVFCLFVTQASVLAQTTTYNAFNQEAEQAYRAGNYAKAIPGLLKSIKRMEARGQTPNKNAFLKQYYRYLAKSYRETGRVEQAADLIVGLLRASALKPYDDPGLVISSSTYLLARTPNDLQLIKWRAQSFEALNRYDDAISDHSKLISLAENDKSRAQAHSDRSWPLRLAGRTDRALADLDQAVRLNPRADYYFNRGQIFKDQKEWERAIPDLENAARLAPEVRSKKDYSLGLATVLRLSGSHARARTVIESLMASHPKERDVRQEYISVLIESGDEAAASRELDSLKADDPKGYAALRQTFLQLLEKRRAKANVVVLSRKVAGWAWQAGTEIVLVPLQHMIGNGNSRSNSQWRTLTARVKELTGGAHTIDPLPELSGSNAEKLQSTLSFIAKQSRALAAAVERESGANVLPVAIFARDTSLLMVLNRMGVTKFNTQFSNSIRQQAGKAMIPDTVWNSFVAAVEVGDRQSVASEWKPMRLRFEAFLAKND